jgi:phosphoribosylformylglycinamidine (FGAM) synthase-like enzyme
VRALIRDGLVTAVHDVSDGGLLVALAEMAMASHIGAVLEAPSGIAPYAFWFGEDQARYVLTAKDSGAVAERAKAAAVRLTQIGATGGRVLAIADERPLLVSELRERSESWLPAYMAAPA